MRSFADTLTAARGGGAPRRRLPLGIEALTGAIAGSVVVTIIGVCFATQALVLGQPQHSDLLAIRTIGTLEHYDGSLATMAINGQRHTTVCDQRWGHAGRVLTVTVDHHVVLRKRGNSFRTRSKRALDEFELAGCPRNVADWLTTQLNDGNRFLVRPTYVYGRRVYELRARAATIGLEVFVLRSAGLPVGLAISGGGLRGRSEVRFTVRPSAHGVRFRPAF